MSLRKIIKQILCRYSFRKGSTTVKLKKNKILYYYMLKLNIKYTTLLVKLSANVVVIIFFFLIIISRNQHS